MKGLKYCSGDFVAILNSDDVWEKEKLQQQLSYLQENPDCGAVFTLVNVIDESGARWPERSNPYQLTFDVGNTDRYGWLRRFYYSGNQFCASSAMVRRECFERVGILDGRYTQLQDFDMWLRIVMGGYKVHVIPERLTNYRVLRDGSNMSAARESTRAAFVLEFARILRNFWQIDSLRELAKTFPDISIAADADETLIRYYLAHHAAALPGMHHRLFALETMLSWGGDYHSMNLAGRCHDFSHADYRSFLARGPVNDLLRLDAKNRVDGIARRILPASWHQKLKTLHRSLKRPPRTVGDRYR